MAGRYSIDTARRRKKPPFRREPYWQKITTGRYLGYRKTETGGCRCARTRLDNHLPERIKHTGVAALRTATLKRWHQSLVRKGDDPEDVRKSRDAANKLLTRLKAALNLAFNRGLVASDTEWRRAKTFRQVRGGRILFPTDDQVTARIDNAEGAFRSLLIAAERTRARYGELAAVKIGDLDTRKGTLQLDGRTGPRVCFLSDETLRFFKHQARNC